jgi:hypothetical protein
MTGLVSARERRYSGLGMAGRPRLRKREIAFAVGAGVLAAAGGAAMLDAFHEDDVRAAPTAIVGNNLGYNVSRFTAVSTAGPQDVVITIGDKFAVRATGTSQALSGLKAEVHDGTLVIRPAGGFGFDWRQFGSATFYVTVPRLEAVSLAGSGSVRLDRAEGPFFSGSVAGPGQLTIGAMKVDRADFSVAGSGDLAASGTARDARLSIGGSGDIRAKSLNSETAAVSIGGSGNVALTVQRNARVSIMGSGDVQIAGPAHCTVSKMGSGDVSCANTDQ